jgi:hypothetical protein
MKIFDEDWRDVKVAIAIGIIWGIGVLCGWYLTKSGVLV